MIRQAKQLPEKRGEWMFNKRSSLEISIQAIVIVVLAMTILGLGLGFVKGMFGNINKISESTFGQIEEQLQRDLVNGNEKLAFSQTRITIARGSSILLGWGIKNDHNSILNYHAVFTPINCPDANGNTQPCSANAIQNWFTYKAGGGSNPTPYSVDAASLKVERVDLSVPKTSVPPGLYLIELAIYDGSGIAQSQKYATADIFITVT